MKVRFIGPAGQAHVVEGAQGESAMDCATRHLIPGIIGECGGAMACATCHGYVDPAWAGRLSPPSRQEHDMIEGCIDVRPTSRLTCQIALDDTLDGLTIEVASSQI